MGTKRHYQKNKNKKALSTKDKQEIKIHNHEKKRIHDGKKKYRNVTFHLLPRIFFFFFFFLYLLKRKEVRGLTLFFCACVLPPMRKSWEKHDCVFNHIFIPCFFFSLADKAEDICVEIMRSTVKKELIVFLFFLFSSVFFLSVFLLVAEIKTSRQNIHKPTDPSLPSNDANKTQMLNIHKRQNRAMMSCSKLHVIYK